MIRNTITAGLLAAAVAVAGGIAVAAPAQATKQCFELRCVDVDTTGVYGGGYMGDHDAYAYMKQIDDLGAPYSVSGARDFGMTVCNTRASGASEDQLVSIGVSSGISSGAAQLAVHGAEYHFCPTYY
jgi:hypothetical protein